MNKIALHEVGHLLALFAVGLGDELEFCSIGNRQYNGKTVDGLTEIEAESLKQYSERLKNVSGKLLQNPQDPDALQEFKNLMNEGKIICLKYIVFYLGGYVIDNLYNQVLTSRYEIDYDKIRNGIFPSCNINSKEISNAKWKKLQDMVYVFLKEFFENNKCLINKLVNELSIREILYKADVEEIFKLCVLFPATEESWNKLKDAFFEWCDDKSIIKNFGA